MMDDTELLQRYAATRAEEMFAELVKRHLSLVYAAALRQTNGAVHRAEDVTQTVFIELARNARALSRRTGLAGWLYTTTHYTAAKLKRAEQRRQNREQEAHLMQEISASEIEWERLRPVLDEAMHELSESDREVILMRFFQAKRFADVGQSLGMTEDAARMRVERALDKLRRALGRREITSTTAALAIALANQPAVAASATLAATVTGAAVASSGAAGVWATFMGMTTLQAGITGVIAVAGATGFAWQANTNAHLQEEVARLREANAGIAALQSDNLQRARLAAEVADLRRDDAELARLQRETADLKTSVAQQARAEEARQARAALLAQLDRTPVARHQVRPQYPAEMRAAGVTGEVLVDFIVDSAGEVKEAKVRKASRPEFEAAAVEAVSNWKFSPGQKSSRAVATRMQVPMVFAIQGVPTPDALSLAAGTGAAAEYVRLQPFVVEAR